jgi:hypothetical protein
MPTHWHETRLSGFGGTVLLKRHFSWPNPLDANERAWLIFSNPDPIVKIFLNGQELKRIENSSASEFEITSLLKFRNDLLVEISDRHGESNFCGEAALEIRYPAFLRNIAAWVEDVDNTRRIIVQGEAVGSHVRPLELYALVEGVVIAYATVTPIPEGQHFQMQSDDYETANRVVEKLSKGPCRLVVDLIDGATVWHRHEEVFDPGDRSKRS